MAALEQDSFVLQQRDLDVQAVSVAADSVAGHHSVTGDEGGNEVDCTRGTGGPGRASTASTSGESGIRLNTARPNGAHGLPDLLLERPARLYHRDVVQRFPLTIGVPLHHIRDFSNRRIQVDSRALRQSPTLILQLSKGSEDHGSVRAWATVSDSMRIHDDSEITRGRGIRRREQLAAIPAGHRYRSISMSATRKANSRLCSRFRRGSQAVS